MSKRQLQDRISDGVVKLKAVARVLESDESDEEMTEAAQVVTWEVIDLLKELAGELREVKA
jgi:hypothetical protein